MILRKLLRLLGHLSWLRFGVRDRVIRFFHNPDKSQSEFFSVPFFGSIYRGNFNTFIDWSVYYYGAYAYEELRLFEDFLSTFENPTVVDVGANVGHHTLFAAMKSGKVICFEPFQDVADRLEQKITDNALSNVYLFKVALGDKNELALYLKPTGQNTGTGSFSSVNPKGDTLTLPVRVGDEILAENNISSVHFIKIDTEGFEPFVLSGLRNTIERNRPLVFFEWTQEEKKNSRDNFTELFPVNYNFFNFISDTPTFVFFRKPAYKLEKLNGKWPDGNLFAVPDEFIQKLKNTNPMCSAGKQIFSALNLRS
ncbi:MAG: FkbM family methyltransferase [Bacteroidetes bacterium]|nr:FkbM family methyltransferase [Bacteroidota bacterium]